MNSTDRREARYIRRHSKRVAKKLSHISKYDNFNDVFSFSNLYDGYRNSIKCVGWKASTQIYKSNAIINIAKTLRELHDGTYHTIGFYEFDIFERGKQRHIRSVHISERCVQRTLCDKCLIPVMSNSFIYDNSANIKGRGYDFALNRCTEHLHRYYRKHGNNGYVLVIDFSKFFDNIQHEYLYKIMDGMFNDPMIISLYKQFIDAFGDTGLGLGSQISQISALAYPDIIDHFIKEKLDIKYYGRYMDDSYIIHDNKEYLIKCLHDINNLCNSIGIKLNTKKTQIIKLSRGFTFLKVKFNLLDTGRVIKRVDRNGIVKMRRKLKKFKLMIDSGIIKMEDVISSYNSYRGHLLRFNSNKTIMSLDLLFYKLFS